MRTVKVAIAKALAAAVETVPVYAVERATLPTLPAVEVIGLTTKLQESGPLYRHLLAIEITASAATEDAADERLDDLAGSVCGRLMAAARRDDPILMPGDSIALVTVGDTRWSRSGRGASGVVRGVAIAVTVEADEG